MNKDTSSNINGFQLFKPKDVADILRISRSQVYSLISIGSLQAVRIGRSVRVSNIDLNRFIDKCHL